MMLHAPVVCGRDIFQVRWRWGFRRALGFEWGSVSD